VNQRNFIDCLALKITALYPNDIFYVRVVPEPCFPGDFNFDGDSDGNDFLTWQQQYTGPLGGLSPSTTTVPEPTAVLLLLTGILSLGFPWGKTRRRALL
jgi:hypothetical protein